MRLVRAGGRTSGTHQGVADPQRGVGTAQGARRKMLPRNAMLVALNAEMLATVMARSSGRHCCRLEHRYANRLSLTSRPKCARPVPFRHRSCLLGFCFDATVFVLGSFGCTGSRLPIAAGSPQFTRPPSLPQTAAWSTCALPNRLAAPPPSQ